MFLSCGWKVTLAKLSGLDVFLDSSGGISDELFDGPGERIYWFKEDMV